MSGKPQSSGDKRQGRGRLSSIDMLPDEAQPDLLWALDQLRERSLPQKVILEEFNARLIALDIKPISKSAWSRYAVRKAIQYRRQDETRRIAGELAASMGTDDADEMTVMIAEMVKIAAFEILEGGELSTKGIMEISRALQSSVSAQKASADYREQLQKRIDAKLAEAAEKVGAIGRKKGVSKAAMKQINDALMGGG